MPAPWIAPCLILLLTMIVADKGGARAVTVPVPYAPGSIPIAVVACLNRWRFEDHSSLSRAEGDGEAALRLSGCSGTLSAFSALNRLVDLDGLLLREQWYTHDHDRRPGPKGGLVARKHEPCCHYRYVLSTMFGSSGGGADHVIIVRRISSFRATFAFLRIRCSTAPRHGQRRDTACSVGMERPRLWHGAATALYRHDKHLGSIDACQHRRTWRHRADHFPGLDGCVHAGFGRTSWRGPGLTSCGMLGCGPRGDQRTPYSRAEIPDPITSVDAAARCIWWTSRNGSPPWKSSPATRLVA